MATIVLQRWASTAPRWPPTTDWRGLRPSSGAKGANIRAHFLITVRAKARSQSSLKVVAAANRD
jgi:hypothetical protein